MISAPAGTPVGREYHRRLGPERTLRRLRRLVRGLPARTESGRGGCARAAAQARPGSTPRPRLRHRRRRPAARAPRLVGPRRGRLGRDAPAGTGEGRRRAALRRRTAAVRRRKLRRRRGDLDPHGRGRLRRDAARGGAGAAAARAARLHRRPSLLRRPPLAVRRRRRGALAAPGLPPNRPLPGWARNLAEGLRARVGATHLPLGLFLQAFLDAGLTLERFEELENREYPYMVALRCRR